MNDDNIYSSSAFLLLLEAKYDLDIPKVASMTKDCPKRLERVKKGVGHLGFKAYNSLKLQLDIPQVDYDGSYVMETT